MIKKLLLNIHIIGNIIAAVVFILFCLGTLTDIKFEFDDPATHPTGDLASQYLYLLLTKFSFLFIALLAFNLFMIFYKNNSSKITHTNDINKTDPIEWRGDLDDDCTAIWRHLMLRSECMKKGSWWWAVYDKSRDEMIVDSSINHFTKYPNGKYAREVAEAVARNYLDK